MLIVKAGRDLERELALLERATWLYPDVPAVLVGDGDQPELAGLAWDLGAACVLLPPQPRERLAEIVAGLMGEKAEPEKGDRRTARPGRDALHRLRRLRGGLPDRLPGHERPTPWMPRPLDCVSCTLCVRVCPTEALRMSAWKRVRSRP